MMIPFLAAGLASAPTAFASGFHVPRIGDQRSAIYDLRPGSTAPALTPSSVPATSFSTASSSGASNEEYVTVGVALRSRGDLRDNAQNILDALNNVFSSSQGRHFFNENPGVSVEPTKIFSDTNEAVLVLRAAPSAHSTPAAQAASAKESLIRFLSTAPGIRFAGETRSISVE